ncbi:MAG TPA: alkaline phosphatase family protein [Pyrinomonadaceae bacterium]|nr:alkaline phosphatase family protein [Pyrinomonadaceae bacterium]
MSDAGNQLDQINHVVVLMMENRSFDNVLGWLYDNENKPLRGQQFEGVAGKDLSNPRSIPSDGNNVPVGRGTVMTDPYPDPHEPYDHVYSQMYGVSPPPNPIPNTTATPPMNGFVVDYANAISAAGAPKTGCNKLLSWLFRGNTPMDFDPGVIMNCFTPESLPVINGLAREYAVCDHWYSSVPTQTFPNRSFVHAATSSGYVTNFWKTGTHDWDIDYLLNKTPTIYNKLSEKGVDWRIYYGNALLLCNALLIQKELWQYLPLDRHFFPFSQFAEDARNGNLPPYTFIEPNMLCSQRYGAENDMHPAFAITATGAATNALYGDELIYKIYEALRNSPAWNSTLLIITFDEHGGTYDHVPTPPPFAKSPDGIVIPPGQPGGSGFSFERFGVRVPAVLVSPLIEKGTICSTDFDHTSIIRTVARRWLNSEHLTERDKHANDVGEVLTLTTPRTDVPPIVPKPPPPFKGCGAHPLAPLHQDLVFAADSFLKHHTGESIHPEALQTTDEAVEALEAREAHVRTAMARKT